MEHRVLKVGTKRLWIFNGQWLGQYMLICLLPIFFFPEIAVYMCGLLCIYILKHILHRGMWVITEVSADEERIILVYYQLWIKKSIEISRQTFGKIQVKERANRLIVDIYDDRFINPPCMRIQFSNYEFGKTCDSKGDVEAVINLFEKYNYHIEYV